MTSFCLSPLPVPVHSAFLPQQCVFLSNVLCQTGRLYTLLIAGTFAALLHRLNRHHMHHSLSP